VNLLGDNTNPIKKKLKNLIDAKKEIHLEANKKKTKCMLLSHHQNTGQNHDIKRAITSFENVAQFNVWERQ
jgi:hypothetical protein